MIKELGYEWVTEGFRQWRLGLAWKRYAWLAGEGERSSLAGQRSDWLSDEVVRPFLEREWLPGVSSAVESTCKTWRGGEAWPVPVAVFDRVQQRFLARLGSDFAEERPDARPLDLAQAETRELFISCFREGTAPEAPRLTPVFVGLAERVQGWLAQGAALDRWLQVAPELEEDDPAARQRVRSLAVECSLLQEATVSRVRELSVMRYLPGSNHQSYKLFRQSARFLARCGKELGALAQALPTLSANRHLQERQQLLHFIQQELKAAPANWPPLLLAKLQSTLAADPPGRLGLLADLLLRVQKKDTWDPQRWSALTERSFSIRARISLAVLLVERLDQLETESPLGSAVWKSVARCVDDLLSGSGHALELVRARSADPERCSILKAAPDRPERLAATGLVLRKPQGQAVVLRKVQIEVPRQLESVVLCLRELAARPLLAGGALAPLCNQLAQEIQAADGLDRWRAQLSSDRLGLMWRVVQRLAALPALHPELQIPALELLQEFERLGFTLVDVARPSEFGDAATGPWLLLADPAVAHTTPLPTRQDAVRGIGLRIPDGRILAPTVWLRVPSQGAERRPVVRCLVDSEPLLAGLKASAPDWPGWKKYNQVLWQLAYVDTAANVLATADVRLLKKMLVDVLHRACETDPVAPAFQQLAQRMYQCLTRELGLATTPQLAFDAAHTWILRLQGPPNDGTRIRWQIGAQPLGEVLAIDRLGTPGDPGKLQVSCGPNLPDELRRWLFLPGPVFPGLASDPAQTPDHPLTAWYWALQSLPWQPARVATVQSEHRNRFQSWVIGPGAGWFDQFIHDLRREPVTPSGNRARQWFRVLQADGWCQCYPNVDLEQGTICWPTGVALPRGHMTWKFSDTVPRGLPLEGRIRFAPKLDLVQGAFSLGSIADASPGFRLALNLEKKVHDAPWIAEELMPAVQALVDQARDHELTGTPIGAPMPLVAPLLDGLLRLVRRLPGGAWSPSAEQPQANPPAGLPAEAGQLDAILELLRSWGVQFGIEILPRHWRFAGPRTLDDLQEPEQTVRRPSFAEDAPGRAVALEQFGLRDAHSVHRPCATCASPGPPPLHYAALRRLLQRVPTPDAQTLLKETDGWPTAALDGNLFYGAAQFFVDFWRTLGAAFREQHPDSFEQLAGLLHELLEREFGLQVFYPKQLQDYPDGWLTLHTQGTIRTGRVRRVLRPGLQTADGDLKVKAIVEVE